MKPLSTILISFTASVGFVVMPLSYFSLNQHEPRNAFAHSPDIGWLASAATTVQAKDHPELVREVHQQVNQFRRERGLEPLTLNPVISAQAREHSVEMARDGKSISHRDFKKRLHDIGKEIPYQAAAENVAANVGYDNPARRAVEGWKNSPGHRKNMLGDFSLTGIGIARSDKGMYFFTQVFIQPRQ